MNSFVNLSSADRRRYCEKAGSLLGIHAPSIEKDYWVCWTLRELFTQPDFGPHLTFKGGTSLAKCWKLIERFSEDLDIVIERAFLGFGDTRNPGNASSQSKREDLLFELRATCQSVIRDKLHPALQRRFQDILPKALNWDLVNDPDDVDKQSLLFHYPTVFAVGGYLRPVVKIEMGARSDTEPVTMPTVQPYLAEALPQLFKDSTFTLQSLTPERTFWEKTMLLHEKTFMTDDSAPKARLARHYYDVWCLIRAGVADRALSDTGLFVRVVEHRAVYFCKGKEIRDTLKPGTFRLLPREGTESAWKKDYEAMREAMFFGETPDFDEILQVVGEFERRLNQV